MSGNHEAKAARTGSAKPPKIDRRIRRTRDTLGGALVRLMHEKPFDNITVQDVLDRAGVSRTTFYTHYRDKDDLFLSDVEDFFELMSTFLTRIAPPRRELRRLRNCSRMCRACVSSIRPSSHRAKWTMSASSASAVSRAPSSSVCSWPRQHGPRRSARLLACSRRQSVRHDGVMASRRHASPAQRNGRALSSPCLERNRPLTAGFTPAGTSSPPGDTAAAKPAD